MADVFEFPMRVRYMEVDAQGVVFNGWYLTFFDEAMTAFLAARGASYAALGAAGADVQLVHVEIDWMAGLRYADDFTVAVATARYDASAFVNAAFDDRDLSQPARPLNLSEQPVFERTAARQP